MNSMFINALKNVHISIPLVLAIVLEVMPIWFPHYQVQCEKTKTVLLMYGIVAAANSGPKQQPN